MMNNEFNNDLEKMKNIMEGVVSVSQANTNSTAVMLRRVNDLEALTKGLSDEVAGLITQISSTDDRIRNLEENEEITTEQCDTLEDAIKRRITGLLGYGSFDYKVYFGEFSKKLRRDAHYKLAVPIKLSRTRKRDFQRYANFIEAYIPDKGVTGLKEDLDRLYIINKNKDKYHEYINRK